MRTARDPTAVDMTSAAPSPLGHRTVIVRLLSSVGTGYFYTFKRPRLAEKMALVKYDPVGTFLACSGRRSRPVPL